MASAQQTKFDAIVVGAGPAGATAAYKLAEKGLRVLLVERGRGSGSKQVFGGRIYASLLKKVFPDLDKAPIHRWVTRERISIVHDGRMLSLDFESPVKHSFTAYLTQFTSWIVGKAVEAGAVYVDEVRVDSLVRKNDRIVGIESGGDIVYADVVVDAEGANRLLLEKLGLVEKAKPDQVALGVKEVIKIGEDKLEERFGLRPGEGMAWLMVGEVVDYLPGGAFIYTNKDSISLGIVVHLGHAMGEAKQPIYTLVEKLRLHPLLRHLWADGDIMEYSAHITIEAGYKYMPHKLATNGLVVVGDAAGLLLDTGLTFRGVDYAVYSGALAAEAIVKARDEGRFDEQTLKRLYEEPLKKSIIYKDIMRHRAAERIMSNPRFLKAYAPAMVDAIAGVFELGDETPLFMESLKKSLAKHRVSMLRMLLDLYRVVNKL
ncbi:MAG: FAD-dependent oxidoreductase [Pyrodictiaceae archaeon]